MRKIAYKIADKTAVSDSLPNGWVTEYTYLDLQKDNSIGEDYIIVDEDQFAIILAESNSDSRMQSFKDAETEKQIAKIAAFTAEAESKRAEQESLNAEFEAFKAWKTSQNQ